MTVLVTSVWPTGSQLYVVSYFVIWLYKSSLSEHTGLLADEKFFIFAVLDVLFIIHNTMFKM
jgi:hypothetical protein